MASGSPTDATRAEAAGAGAEAKLPLPFAEFITLMALLMSMTAMSIDIMLPSLPDIGASLSVANANDLQLVVSVYMLGMSLGQLLWGPIADRLGRRPTLMLGLSLFIAATLVAITSQSFVALLAARFSQGLGSAVGRIVVTAIVRDLFAGRRMASVMSTVMMVFILVPILAPAVGQLILLAGTWRWIFTVLLLAGATGFVWVALRLPETRPLVAPGSKRLTLLEAAGLVVGTRATRGYAIASGFMFGCLVAYIASAQQVFGSAYDLGRLFPVAFGSVGCALAAASFTNARVVQRLGMRRVSQTALVALLVASAGLATLALAITLPLWLALGGMMLCFFCYGLILSNFNAIAMQPVGQAAGVAASIIGFYSTATGAILGSLIGRQFAGTVLPLFAGFAALAFCALLTVIITEGRGAMFRGE
ncbi:MAG: multidrug effflux MFS transporter [Hyphomicrobiaceae bacterium]